MVPLVRLSLLVLIVHLHGTHEHWQHEKQLDQDGVVVLRWNRTLLSPRLSHPDEDSLGPTRAASSGASDGVLLLELAARTKGYIGFGLSPYTGTMAGADLVIAWVDDGGVPHARDYWADQNGSPTLDKTQDWSVLGATQNDTHTVVRLARPLRTQHVMDVQISPGPIRIIFSWSGADPGRTPHYHGKEQRGVTEVCLLAESVASRRLLRTQAGQLLWLGVTLCVTGLKAAPVAFSKGY